MSSSSSSAPTTPAARPVDQGLAPGDEECLFRLSRLSVYAGDDDDDGKEETSSTAAEAVDQCIGYRFYLSHRKDLKSQWNLGTMVLSSVGKTDPLSDTYTTAAKDAYAKMVAESKSIYDKAWFENFIKNMRVGLEGTKLDVLTLGTPFKFSDAHKKTVSEYAMTLGFDVVLTRSADDTASHLAFNRRVYVVEASDPSSSLVESA